jgi:alkanesulfonate monooxygenase SsuD/methylene tetrahydromethanopterin reductase-like flavin-dependent oxidoreductase (luciferase family)
MMDFSVWPDNESPFGDTLAVVRACEGFHWHAAYYADHFMPNGPDETPLRGDTNEALTSLAALGAATSTIRLGTLVASATYRHPALAAKSFATLDHISNGRAIVGLGAGWQINEHASYGIELGTIGERVSRFEEYVEIVASLLHHESTTFAGTYYSFTDAPCDPRPVQADIPLLLGVRGKKRTMALAARFAGIWNAWTTPDDLAMLNDVLNQHCAAVDRDPSTLRRTTQAQVFISHDEGWLAKRRGGPAGIPVVVGTPSEVVDIMAKYQAAGCDEFIVPSWWSSGTERALETLNLFNDEVAVHFR